MLFRNAVPTGEMTAYVSAPTDRLAALRDVSDPRGTDRLRRSGPE